MIRSDGTRIWVDHSVGVLRDVDGSPAGFVSQFVDVTQSRQDRVRLQFLASHDPLTGLLNRRYFLDQFQLILRHPKSPGHHIAVLYIDLDNLKPINDHFSHRAGDAVLTAVAHRLRETVRRDDLVARIGGDEFVVALTTIHAATDAATVALQDPPPRRCTCTRRRRPHHHHPQHRHRPGPARRRPHHRAPARRRSPLPGQTTRPRANRVPR